MRNLKKIIAVVVTLVMLIGVVGISASAAEAPVFSLNGKAETGLTETEGDVKEFYELAVHLDDANGNVGGIEGVISYNTTSFEYVGVDFNSAFVAAGNPENSVIDAETAGSIKFVGLANATGEWFVLKFKVKAEGNCQFSLSAKAANKTGTAYLNVTANGDSTKISANDIINVEGAAILKTAANNGTQDLRFNIVVDDTAISTENPAVEVGVLMMFTKRLGYRDLTVEMIDDENVTGLVVAKKTIAEGESVSSFVTNVRNMQRNALGVRVSARAYIKLADGETVIYSKNFNSEFETNSGYASESVIGVAIDAINAGDCGEVPAEITEIIGKTSISEEERTTLMTFLYENYNA